MRYVYGKLALKGVGWCREGSTMRMMVRNAYSGKELRAERR